MTDTIKPRSAVKMVNDATGKLMARREPWARAHANEMTFGLDGPGVAISIMLKGWAKYADEYAKEFDGALIGDDGVLGDEWKQMGSAIIGLLNGPTGKLDCGSIDRIAREIAHEYGVEEEL